ncbi:MAG: hypothetical protein PWR13_643 [Archaeoglobi archaeon]|nr:hypothetical protein [Archaeoglobi archaeon]
MVKYTFSSTRVGIWALLKTEIPSSKKKEIKEFKFSKTNIDTKIRILERIAKLDMQFSAVVLRKETVYPHLREKKQRLHNYLTGFIVELIPLMSGRDFEIIVDKFINNRADRENFDEYLQRHVDYQCQRLGLIPPNRIDIRHESSQACAGLQVADFVAGSLFAKYERHNEEFYNIIKPKERIIKEKFRR